MYSATAKVTSIRSTKFPGISEVEFRNPAKKILFKVELPQEIITFSKNDELKITFSKSSRVASKGLQLKVYGKVIRKQQGDPKKIRLSFYGLQGWLSVPKGAKLNLNIMDEVYFFAHKE
ncbi:MAG: DNA-directed RNA polymerase subunit G [Candidatus Ranarchaeia archaeon]